MDGVIYVATGPGYRELAEASALSLRQTNPGLGVDLFTDRPDAVRADLFDRVQPVPRDHPRAKIDCLPLTRFERTLYLDCDTLVLRSLGDLFGIADRFPLALAHDMRRASALVQAGHRAATPYAFPQLNSGVMLYRLCDRMQAFWAEWRQRYDAAGASRDQVTLKDLLWESDLRFYVLPPEFNLRRLTLLDAWEPLDCLPMIVHSHRLHQHLGGAVPRVAGLDELLALERAALVAEWRSQGAPRPDPVDPGSLDAWALRDPGAADPVAATQSDGCATPMAATAASRQLFATQDRNSVNT